MEAAFLDMRLVNIVKICFKKFNHLFNPLFIFFILKKKKKNSIIFFPEKLFNEELASSILSNRPLENDMKIIWGSDAELV